jgi:putative SOS response-associated peptidase YedK
MHHFGLGAEFQLPIRYNVSPGSMVPIIRQVGTKRELAMVKWGLVPSWSAEPKVKFATFNARSEEAATKRMYRSAIKHRRCLIPADGFYEWETIGKQKFPHYYQLHDQSPFAFGNGGTKPSRQSKPARS